MINLKTWLTTKEACQLVDRTRTTLNTWKNEDLIRVRYVGEKPLFNKDDLLQAKKEKELNRK